MNGGGFDSGIDAGGGTPEGTAAGPAGRLRGPGGREIPVRRAPVVIVGAGVAGLSAALGLHQAGIGSVVVTPGTVGRAGSSPLAQGGVAAAVGADDDPAGHAADTVAVAAGLADAELARIVTAAAPDAIAELVALGTPFDRAADGALTLGREAGHGRRRIVHARGDSSGAAIMDALAAAVRARSGSVPAAGCEPATDGPEEAWIELWEHTRAVDLIRGGPDGCAVVGVLVLDAISRPTALLAPAVVLATGGYAHCFARTTTPADVIGSGVAMAARAGARMADLEMVQFHPTALDVPGAGRLPLLTEALRGEGAILVDEHGDRFMPAEHPDAELAPRDVVARAIYRQLTTGHRPCLDARAAVGDAFPQRFPTVFALAREHGFDPRTEPLPVTPAAHYCMGGVAVDAHGRTSLPGLWAAGEVASSGLHGGNRLASNSLLEGLVMGRRVAADLAPSPSAAPFDPDPATGVWLPTDVGPVLTAADGAGAHGVVEQVRQLLWESAGVVRHGDGLVDGLARLSSLAPAAAADLDSRNTVVVATLVLRAALARTESRGAHHRSDHPEPDPDQAVRHFDRPHPVPLERWAPLGAPSFAGS